MSFSALVLGRRRQGKSTLALPIAAARSNHIVVFDPNCQYRAFPPALFSQEYLDEQLSNLDGCLVVLQPDFVDEPDRRAVIEDWRFLARTLWDHRNERPYSLIIDESSWLQSAGSRDDWLDRYVRQAPDSMSIIQTTHRVIDISKLVRSLATDLFLFRTTIEADLTVLESEFPGLRTDVIQKLPAYHVLHYWAAKGGYERHNLWDNPGEWYVNISARESGSVSRPSSGAGAGFVGGPGTGAGAGNSSTAERRASAA